MRAPAFAASSTFVRAWERLCALSAVVASWISASLTGVFSSLAMFSLLVQGKLIR